VPGFFLRIDIMVDIFSYTDVQCYVIVARSATGSKKNFSSPLSEAGSQSTRYSSIFANPGGVAATQCPTNPNRDLGAHRAALCRCGNRRNVNLSPDKVRELFENEPGVLVIGERSPRHKRRYVTLRILRKCSNASIIGYHRSLASGRSIPRC